MGEMSHYAASLACFGRPGLRGIGRWQVGHSSTGSSFGPRYFSTS
jgi:hypothetical protein